MQDKHDPGTIDWVDKPGLTPRGKKMPQTVEEWRHLGDLYEQSFFEMVREIGHLKAKINGLTQKVSVLRRENDTRQ